MSHGVDAQNKVIEILRKDERILHIINVVSQFPERHLYLSGGVLRNTIWDMIFSTSKKCAFNDVDIIYIDSYSLSEDQDIEIEAFLNAKDSSIPWSVRNQCRMARKHGHPIYKSVKEAISFWVETATAVAYGPASGRKPELLAPYGVNDLLDGIVRPTAEHLRGIMMERVEKKAWMTIYPDLIIK